MYSNMKPVRDIIVQVDENYKDSITLKNGQVIYLNQVFRQVKDTIRCGKVVALPPEFDYDVQVGDTLFFHHGIVAETLLNESTPVPSPYMIDAEKKWYMVPVDERWPMFYARLRDGEFKCTRGSLFIRPIVTKKYHSDHLIMPGNEKELKNIGEVAYSNAEMEEQGVKPGTKVIFEKDSEYEFEIDGETLYRMFDRWILGIYNG